MYEYIQNFGGETPHSSGNFEAKKKQSPFDLQRCERDMSQRSFTPENLRDRRPLEAPLVRLKGPTRRHSAEGEESWERASEVGCGGTQDIKESCGALLWNLSDCGTEL